MPKGADLHMHLSGAIYAETFIADAARDGLCVAPVERGNTARGPSVRTRCTSCRRAGKANDCAAGQVPVSDALKNQALYDLLVDSFSMRAFVPPRPSTATTSSSRPSGAWRAEGSTAGEWLDEVATRAAAQNEQYLEIMQTPPSRTPRSSATRSDGPTASENTVDSAELAELRDQLFAAGLRDEVAVDQQRTLRTRRSRATRDRARNPARQSAATPGRAHVQIHFLYQVLRGFPPQQVFAQTLLGFEVASADPDVVGINFVMPEDGCVSMRDYHLQMQMLDYLHSVYPKVHISLHAGELAPGMVPPAGLSFHIREAI